MKTINLPGFSAEAVLYPMSKNYNLVSRRINADLGKQFVTPAGFLCDWFPWLPWCPEPSGDVSCFHAKTDTYCTGVVLWCKDNSICTDGSTRSSGWYPCGACLGWGW